MSTICLLGTRRPSRLQSLTDVCKVLVHSLRRQAAVCWKSFDRRLNFLIWYRSYTGLLSVNFARLCADGCYIYYERWMVLTLLGCRINRCTLSCTATAHHAVLAFSAGGKHQRWGRRKSLSLKHLTFCKHFLLMALLKIWRSGSSGKLHARIPIVNISQVTICQQGCG